MRKVMRRYGNNIIWIASFVGCVVFSLVMLTGILFVMRSNMSAQIELENSYKKSFFEMADSVNDIEVNLSKMMVSVNDEQTVEIAEKVRLQTQIAQSSLNQLPVNAETAHDINKFFNQVGDWCASYCRAMVGDGEISVYEDKVEEIYAVTKNINAELKDIATDFNNVNYSVINNLKHKNIRSAGDFALSYDALKSSSIEYPELIYDGPFSDKDGKKCFKALEKFPELSQAQVFEIVGELFGDMGVKNLKSIGTTTQPNAYEIMCDFNGGIAYLSISKNGGKLMSLNSDIVSSSDKIGKERAMELAVSYAERCNYCNDLGVVWYNSIDGVAYVNLAPVTNGVILYPDLVKVKVSLEDGGLIALEASGFCTNYCKRDIIPSIDEKTAKSMISPKLNVSGCRLAIIPINHAEKLCYEVICDYKGLDYFVYIDAIMGKQVNILRVVDEKQGEMVL